MNKFYLALTLCLAASLIACGGKFNENITAAYATPPELKDCQVHYLRSSEVGVLNLYVVRCPNSTTSTTYTSGKSQRTTVTIDGVEYAPVQK